jgi:hypothetical protein
LEFTAYGQAALEMATGMFELLRQHKARLFASAIPCSVIKPDTYEAEEYLRRVKKEAMPSEPPKSSSP